MAKHTICAHQITLQTIEIPTQEKHASPIKKRSKMPSKMSTFRPGFMICCLRLPVIAPLEPNKHFVAALFSLVAALSSRSCCCCTQKNTCAAAAAAAKQDALLRSVCLGFAFALP